MSRRRTQRASLLRDLIDARALLAYLLVMIVLAFALQQPVAIAALTAAVWLVVVGVLEPLEYRGYALYGAISALAVMLLNPLVSRMGETVLWTGPQLPLIGAPSVSAEAIVFGVAMGLRLFGVVGVFALYAVLVDPDALYRLIAPLSIGSALVTALSIRLFPATVRDTRRISDAMRSRGLELDAGGLRTRVSARVPVMTALFMTSLDRAMSLAESLEARGYGRPDRSRLSMPGLAPRDLALMGVSAVLCAVGIGVAVSSAGFSYYPVLGDPASTGDLIAAGVLGVLAALPLAMEWGWGAWLSSKSRG